MDMPLQDVSVMLESVCEALCDRFLWITLKEREMLLRIAERAERANELSPNDLAALVSGLKRLAGKS